MVHVFCLNEKCRRICHLGDHAHWNYKGKVKCKRCGEVMEVEIKDGELVSAEKSKEK
jgi:hypothetical protein